MFAYGISQVNVIVVVLRAQVRLGGYAAKY